MKSIDHRWFARVTIGIGTCCCRAARVSSDAPASPLPGRSGRFLLIDHQTFPLQHSVKCFLTVAGILGGQFLQAVSQGVSGDLYEAYRTVDRDGIQPVLRSAAGCAGPARPDVAQPVAKTHPAGGPFYLGEIKAELRKNDNVDFRIN